MAGNQCVVKLSYLNIRLQDLQQFQPISVLVSTWVERQNVEQDVFIPPAEFLDYGHKITPLG